VNEGGYLRGVVGGQATVEVLPHCVDSPNERSTVCCTAAAREQTANNERKSEIERDSGRVEKRVKTDVWQQHVAK